MISCTFERDDKDIAACYHYFFSDSTFVAKQRNRLTMSDGLSMLLCLVFLWWLSTATTQDKQYFTLARTFGLWGTTFPVFYWLNSPKRRANKLTKDVMKILHEYPKESKACTVTMSDEGITFSDPNTEHRYSWPAVHKMDITDEYMTFIFAGAHLAAIPKAKVDLSVMQQMHQLAVEKVNKTGDSLSKAAIV